MYLDFLAKGQKNELSGDQTSPKAEQSPPNCSLRKTMSRKNQLRATEPLSGEGEQREIPNPEEEPVLKVVAESVLGRRRCEPEERLREGGREEGGGGQAAPDRKGTGQRTVTSQKGYGVAKT